MKTIKQTVAPNNAGNYVSPAAAVSEMHTEGVLCGSGTGAFKDLEEEVLPW